MKNKEERISLPELPPRRLMAATIFLAVSAIPLSLVYVFFAPIMFIAIILFHIPYALIFLVALFIVRETVYQTQRRLYRTSALIGLIIGIVDFCVDLADVKFMPWLERSPGRPIIRVIITSAICMIVSWLILRIITQRNSSDQIVDRKGS